ncbi:hypothetical protein, partial [Burkholderia vietnamiensis]|uniref:hypothetical protein n=3 Tax=Burkholderia vietnamiensis TaxID=60552 RepID=UPI001ABB51EC
MTNDGMDHIGDRHLDPTVNASQFSINESDLKTLLQSPATVSTPVSRTIQSGGDINYVREVNAGQVIGPAEHQRELPVGEPAKRDLCRHGRVRRECRKPYA